MIHRTIAVALLAGLASPVLANPAPATGPAYDQAAGLAAGRSADAVYDGGAARTPVQAQVAGALQTGGLAVERPSEAAPSTMRPALTDAAVPEPSHAAGGGKFFNKTTLLYGAGGAATGAGIGWLLGGLLGAAIGAAAGFAIGFLLSKVLKHH
jgi:hypothetical protein